MSDIRGAWVPETPAEDELLMDLHEATRKAHNAGVDPSDIVGGMNYLSAAIALYGDESGFVNAAEQRDHQEEEVKIENCPECDTPIESVKPFIGGDVRVEPCGCFATVHQVSGWIDGPGEGQ